MEKGQPAKMLLQKLSQRLLCSLYLKKRVAIDENFQTIVSAYQDCKMIKFSNYTYASWSIESKCFDGNVLTAALEDKLKSSETELCEFIESTLSKGAINSIWAALSYRRDMKMDVDLKYLVNASILRKIVPILMKRGDLLDKFAVKLFDALLLNCLNITRLLKNTDVKDLWPFLLEIRKIIITLDSILEKMMTDIPHYADNVILKQLFELESLKTLLGNLPKKCKKIRSLFEYLLLEFANKLIRIAK